MEKQTNAEVQQSLLTRARRSDWIMTEQAAHRPGGTTGDGLELLSTAQLVDLLAGRNRSKEWRATAEYVTACHGFQDRIAWTESALELEPRIARLQTLSRMKWWRDHELSYRLAPPDHQHHSGFYDETIAFFRTIMNRADEDLCDTDELMAGPAAEAATASSSNPTDAAGQRAGGTVARHVDRSSSTQR